MHRMHRALRMRVRVRARMRVRLHTFSVRTAPSFPRAGQHSHSTVQAGLDRIDKQASMQLVAHKCPHRCGRTFANLMSLQGHIRAVAKGVAPKPDGLGLAECQRCWMDADAAAAVLARRRR